MQDKYWAELSKQSDWLKFAWHKRQGDPAIVDNTETEIESFHRVHSLINAKNPDLWTKTIRLHSWEISKEVLDFMRKTGAVETLLTADRPKRSYDLTGIEQDILKKKGRFEKNNIKYLETKIRFDWLEEGIGLEKLYEITRNFMKEESSEKLIVFCHEWAFDRIKNKIERYWESLLKDNY